MFMQVKLKDDRLLTASGKIRWLLLGSLLSLCIAASAYFVRQQWTRQAVTIYEFELAHTVLTPQDEMLDEFIVKTTHEDL